MMGSMAVFVFVLVDNVAYEGDPIMGVYASESEALAMADLYRPMGTWEIHRFVLGESEGLFMDLWDLRA
jgi:hypothetical protein